jgi:hypothetical protein
MFALKLCKSLEINKIFFELYAVIWLMGTYGHAPDLASTDRNVTIPEVSADLLSSFSQLLRILPVIEDGDDDGLLSLDEVVNAIKLEAAHRRTPDVSKAQAVAERVLNDHGHGIVEPVEELKAEAGFVPLIPSGRTIGFSFRFGQLSQRVRHANVAGCGR